MAVPAKSQPGTAPDWCYISSGTWSLMGVEVPEPVVSDRCRELNFTNEGGVGGTTRLLKNIAGLWLVQECRRIWKLGGKDYGWSELVAFAQQAAPLRSLIDPCHSCFVAPENMPQQIQQHCRDTGQLVPETEGQIIRCVLEGLALRYRLVHSWLEELSGAKIDTIHIVGGGTQNRELCQMAADACNCRVIAGPVEATAIGNLMVQVVATGEVGSIAEAREVIRNSFDVQEFLPENPAPWDDAFGRFQGVLAR
jgi:rhamnulokinase